MAIQKTRFWLYLTPVWYLLLCPFNSTQWGFDTCIFYLVIWFHSVNTSCFIDEIGLKTATLLNPWYFADASHFWNLFQNIAKVIFRRPQIFEIKSRLVTSEALEKMWTSRFCGSFFGIGEYCLVQEFRFRGQCSQQAHAISLSLCYTHASTISPEHSHTHALLH